MNVCVSITTVALSPLREEMPVVLTHVVSPRCFYGYLSSSSSSVDKLCKDMSEYYGVSSECETAMACILTVHTVRITRLLPNSYKNHACSSYRSQRRFKGLGH